MVKNPLANAGYTGLIPGPGRSAHEPQLLSPGTSTTEAYGHQEPATREDTAMKSPQTGLFKEQPHLVITREKPVQQ